MAGFFVKFNTTIMDAINQLGATYQAQYSTGIMSLMLGSITLYVVWFGYSTLGGKQPTPVPDLVWNLARFAIIITFITNAGGYLTSLSAALEGLKEGFSGSTSVWATLDQLWESTQKLATKVYEQDNSTYVPLEGGIGLALVWGGSIVLMLISSVVFLTADLTMKFMLITAPIFIFCLMFGFLRPMFNNWVQLIFSSILTVLFASLVINLAVNFQGDILTQVSAQVDGNNIVTMGAMGGVVGVLAAMLVTISAGFAAKLAGAGAEGAIQGMAMAGLSFAAKKALKPSRKVGNGNTPDKPKPTSPSPTAPTPATNPNQAKSKAAVEKMKAQN